MNLKFIKANENHTLTLEMQDGRVGEFSVKPFLDFEVFKPLNEISEFFKVHNRNYYIEWDSGADLSLDTILSQTKFK